MSSDIKYIGMDVHKEAISIAVLNSSGKQSEDLSLEVVLRLLKLHKRSVG